MNSKLKTWLKRNGFIGEGSKGSRQPMRECNGYVVRKGRHYRIRGDVVDIGERTETFDRWANSTERTIPLVEFKAAMNKEGK